VAERAFERLRRLDPTVDEMRHMLAFIGGWNREAFDAAVASVEEQRARLAESVGEVAA